MGLCFRPLYIGVICGSDLENPYIWGYGRVTCVVQVYDQRASFPTIQRLTLAYACNFAIVGLC